MGSRCPPSRRSRPAGLRKNSCGPRREELRPTATSRTRVVHCTDDTKFWLDQSKRRLVNREGSLADCRPGLRIEVKYVGNDKDDAVAEWVKVEVTGSN